MDRRKFVRNSSLAMAALMVGPLRYENGEVIGHGNKRYKLDTQWSKADVAKNPVNDCHEMVQDSKGRIILLTNETKNNILIYDKKGKLLKWWGTSYPGAHGLTLFNENGTEVLFICDNNRHQVIKTTLDGRELMVIDYPKETGKYTKAEEFVPTETAIAPNGDIYVADGYGKDFIIWYEAWFESSGTTGTTNSKHFLRSEDIYRQSFTKGFQQFYGDPADWCIIGLLPAYLEREHSSLVVMADELIRLSGHPQSGFYLYNYPHLQETLQKLEMAGQRVLLIGVTFALLDFAETFPMKLEHTTIMETGGMKGRRKEITRAELHEILAEAFGQPPIHSEYGMTEMLSQAYAGDNGFFYTPPWLKILLREEDDPLAILPPGGYYPAGGTRRVVNGAINLVDLANLDSCCFIATEDMGRLHEDGGFEVLGRIDNSDIRGCSLMTI